MTAAATVKPASLPVRTSRQRLGPALIRAVVRNPLEALPPEVFDDFVVEGWGPLGRALHITDPDLIQDILVRRSELWPKTPLNRRVLGPTLGEGLLVAEGAHWRRQRRAAAPVFQPARLGALLPAMLRVARVTRDRWLATRGEGLRINHEAMRTTFEIILATMLSGPGAVDPEAFERDMADTLGPVSWLLAVALLGLPDGTPFPGRSRARRGGHRLREATRALVQARRAAAQGAPDLLTLLEAAVDPETGRGLSDEELVDNLLTFIAAGHETTALGLSWTLHLLAAHPDVEARVVAEIDAVTGGAEVTPAHVERLGYVRQVFSEAMRLFPPAPIISRGARQATELAGAEVPAGQVVVIPVYAVHRHRRLWREPDRFDPDRFAPEATGERHRFAFMPFGGGPHVCIGSSFAMQEATAILAVILQRIRLTPLRRAEPPRAVMRVTLRPFPEIEMRAEARGG
jgi:cytochrome P450